MSSSEEDTGVIETLLDRLNKYRLPRLLELKERVDRGEAISENDLKLLERIMHDARAAHALVDRHPEVQAIYTQVTALYAEITGKALENEQKPEA